MLDEVIDEKRPLRMPPGVVNVLLSTEKSLRDKNWLLGYPWTVIL